jgi:hypothetical protein
MGTNSLGDIGTDAELVPVRASPVHYHPTLSMHYDQSSERSQTYEQLALV